MGMIADMISKARRSLPRFGVLAGLGLLAACGTTGGGAPKGKAALSLKPVSYSELAGWSEDAQGEVLSAWRQSCGRLERKRDTDPFSDDHIAFGTVGDWRRACTAAVTFDTSDHAAMRRFLEAHFVPFAVAAGSEREGLFTGYFEPELRGARLPGGNHVTPIRARPDDLVEVDLGAFRPELKGERIAGRVVDGKLAPYPDREDIAQGALQDKEDVLVWVDDPVDAFFLHIQGSGRVRLDDGTVMRVGYAGQNGHPYTAIGKILIDEGELTRQNVSMQTIRAWLKANPRRAREIMHANKSYIFFRNTGSGEASGPLGAEGVPLTAKRSLAVDDAYYAYGLPVWLETTAPKPYGGGEDTVRRLMIAQDTGGAIRGPVRGDVYWGAGLMASQIAGAMKNRGQLYVLLPRPLAARQGWLSGKWVTIAAKPGA